MSADKPKTGWKKAAVLVAAGLGSFVLAAAMQGKLQAGDEDLDLAAAPRQRPAPAAPPQAGAVPAFPVEDASQRVDVAMNSPSLRMNKMVVRDPFGPLAPEFVPPPQVVAPPPPPPAPVKAHKPPPPPVAAEPAPPPPPTAPPLPFTAVGAIQGKKIANGQLQAFIQHGDNLSVIQKGDTVAGSYRVDEITSDRVVFTYLPLGQKQSLQLLDNPR
ncbi:hypothetical protein [Polaromonas sp. JS666]|uniref:hypothetical protein n=1 Tax=Polaromonas sp. (strain JS666 / ATCC BAA-500) TaxID=296591 RepID=UPI000885AB45|nr:hypothetical protein [Polaromonas sp. JS666]SDO23204.1 hypothetical protein SAMN05720382_1209 [Polaromonas sp. JS666]